jgi:hypothetical protein
VAHPPEPVANLAVDLCYPDPPGIDKRALINQIRAAFPGTGLVWNSWSGLLLRHDQPDPARVGRPDPTEILGLPPEAVPLSENGHEPADGYLLHSVRFAPEPAPDIAGHDLSQSWRWPDAGAALSQCRYTVSITQLVGSRRPAADRLAAFRATLNAVVALARPLATWWPASQQALPPGALVVHRLTGVVNVRTFRAVDDPAVTVTDTLGLHTVGLPDLQCQSRQLDLDKLGELLLQLAEYMFDHGDRGVGPGFPGIVPGQRFTVGRAGSAVPPVRAVLDLDPGRPYAV